VSPSPAHSTAVGAFKANTDDTAVEADGAVYVRDHLCRAGPLADHYRGRQGPRCVCALVEPVGQGRPHHPGAEHRRWRPPVGPVLVGAGRSAGAALEAALSLSDARTMAWKIGTRHPAGKWPTRSSSDGTDVRVVLGGSTRKPRPTTSPPRYRRSARRPSRDHGRASPRPSSSRRAACRDGSRPTSAPSSRSSTRRGGGPRRSGDHSEHDVRAVITAGSACSRGS
jgi:hypothetical protein